MEEQKNRYLREVRDFITANFPVAGKIKVADTDDLLTRGIVDSLGLLLVIDFVERQYGISVHETEVIQKNFGSLDALSSFILSKVSAPST